MPIVAHGVSKLTGVPIRFNASHMAKPPHLPSSASSGLLYVHRGLLCLHRGLTTCLRRGFLYLRQKLQSKPTIAMSASRIAFSTPSMIVMSTPRTTIYMPRTTIIYICQGFFPFTYDNDRYTNAQASYTKIYLPSSSEYRFSDLTALCCCRGF